MSIKKHHRFKGLATLELPKDTLEQRAEHLGGDRVKDLVPVRVARDPLNAVVRIHLYAKATGMSRWLLGLVILRELLIPP